jgi:hypothetical protein
MSFFVGASQGSNVLYVIVHRTCCFHITAASSHAGFITPPPLTNNMFGIVNISMLPNLLNYAYHEFTSKKGIKNAASPLIQDVYNIFWLRKDDPGKTLVIAMDNCGGQNKNNIVLRLVPYLMEMGYFRTV